MTASRPKASPAVRQQVGTVTLTIAIYAIAYLVWERAGWGSPKVRDLVGNVAFMPLNLVVALLYGLAGRSLALDPRVRRALLLTGIGSLLVFIGNSISVYLLEVRHESPPVSWADPFYLADSLLMLAGLLCFPLARRARHEWGKFALDVAMVLIGGSVVIWYFAVRPTASSGGSDLVVLALAFAYPLTSLLLVLGITTVLLGRPVDRNRLAFGLLVGGMFTGIVADLTFGLVLVDTGHRSASWTDAVYLLMYLLLVASGELYLRRSVPRPLRQEEFSSPVQPFSPLPYLAVAITYSLLLGAAVTPWMDPLSVLAVSAISITVLVVARQILAVRENVKLLKETAARQNEARFSSLVQHSSDVILVVDEDANVRFVSPSVHRVFGYQPAEVLDRPLAELLHPEDVDQALGLVRDAARTSGVTPPMEWRVRHPDGSWIHAETIATNLLREPTVEGVVLNTRDVSERKQLEQQLTHQAFHDPLTGLANRALFRDRVSHALTLARRQQRMTTVLFLDLDDFKKVNDSLGHAEGDRLLDIAARRFLTCARAADTVARIGGDEFAILIEDVAQDGHAAVVDRLHQAMAEPFLLGNTEVVVNASIGIASASGEESADDLLRNADVAMYAAKRRGKGQHQIYQSQMSTDAKERLEMEAALRGAVDRGELILHYQPIVIIRTGEIYGVEALVRWDHPRFGALLPHAFIPLAEETGIILQVGNWVIRAACRQVQAWRGLRPGSQVAAFVNMSSRQLHSADIIPQIRSALEATGVPPSALVLEITESMLMQQTDVVLQRLHDLKALGLRLAIDDFGTGYSSLSYLQRFPLDILKIAKPFVDEVAQGGGSSALARAIIGLGNTLGLHTIAEGIEVEAQRATLAELGCDLGQGFLFARALPPAEIDRLFSVAGASADYPRILGDRQVIG